MSSAEVLRLVIACGITSLVSSLVTALTLISKFGNRLTVVETKLDLALELRNH